MWMSEISDSHDIWCGCDTPFSHLLASIFPPDHTDRNLTIQQILTRDYQQCHSGGHGERGLGMAGGLEEGDKDLGIKEEEEEEYIKDEELENLIAAGEDAGTR